ncbi:hypothetical protein CFELI_06890 [Corynebacterium felinum]|uniref:Short-subunit dehydrogenase n=1 Tax=Corynebacterium felinum TaxID=131318 RepID=A0ABU2BAM1_9CORY|nr:short-subunit dehydrogenase [Corynebacterium felinum]WJY94994.1 hypothetical protein CFELI_06890 [Corynebacterium felinum]
MSTENSEAASTSKPRCVLVLGATSEIGGEIATRLAPGMHMVLASRRPADLSALAHTLRESGALGVESLLFDAANFPAHAKLIADVAARYTIEHAVVCFGILGDQQRAESSWEHAAEIATVDYTAQIVALTSLAQQLLAQGTAATITAFRPLRAGGRGGQTTCTVPQKQDWTHFAKDLPTDFMAHPCASLSPDLGS